MARVLVRCLEEVNRREPMRLGLFGPNLAQVSKRTRS